MKRLKAYADAADDALDEGAGEVGVDGEREERVFFRGVDGAEEEEEG